MSLVEETTSSDPRNLKISLEDVGGSTQGRRAQHGYIPHGYILSPSSCPLAFLGVLACLPVSQQSCLQTLGLALAVSEALSMGIGFRWGWGRRKAAGGMVSVEPQQEQGGMLWVEAGETLIFKSTWL